MIEFISGKLVSKYTDRLVIQAGGIGLSITVSVITINNTPELGEDITMPVYLYVREDEMSLFGFLAMEEKEFFKLLIQVSGIGPRLAMGMLSYDRAENLRHAIVMGNLAALTEISGIGKKTAERLILELKDKLLKTGDTKSLYQRNEKDSGLTGGTGLEDDDMATAAAALIALGYQQSEIQRAMAQAASSGADNTESLIRAALNQLWRY